MNGLGCGVWGLRVRVCCLWCSVWGTGWGLGVHVCYGVVLETLHVKEVSATNAVASHAVLPGFVFVVSSL